VLLGLTTAQKIGLAGVAAVFVGFSLIVSMVIPRYRPDFPGRRGLGLFIAVTIVLLIAMLGAVEVFAVESEEEPHEESPAAIDQPVEAEPPPSEADSPPPPPAEPPPPPPAEPPPPAAPAETTLENPADESQLRFQKSTLEAPAGAITLVMENPSAIEHNIAVRGGDVDEEGDVVGEGGESTVTADLAPGEYEFYCSVPGHEEAGMKGTLTVTE
jgi:plastocyanin